VQVFQQCILRESWGCEHQRVKQIGDGVVVYPWLQASGRSSDVSHTLLSVRKAEQRRLPDRVAHKRSMPSQQRDLAEEDTRLTLLSNHSTLIGKGKIGLFCVLVVMILLHDWLFVTIVCSRKSEISTNSFFKKLL